MIEAAALWFALSIAGPNWEPPEFLLKRSSQLPLAGKMLILRRAESAGWYFPDRETADLDKWFDGTFYVIWCRARGNPLRFPDDPILGMRSDP